MFWSNVRKLLPLDLLPLGTALQVVADQADECREAQPDFGDVVAEFERCLLVLRAAEDQYQLELGETRVAQQALIEKEANLRRTYARVRGRFVVATEQGEENANLADILKNYPAESRLRRNALAAKSLSLLNSAEPYRPRLAGIGLPAALDRLAIALNEFGHALGHREVEDAEDRVASSDRRDAAEALRRAIRRMVNRLELDGSGDTLARLGGIAARHLPSSGMSEALGEGGEDGADEGAGDGPEEDGEA